MSLFGEHDEGAILAHCFSGPPPRPGLVRWWEDDGQGGGSVIWVTKEEWDRREAERIAEGRLPS